MELRTVEALDVIDQEFSVSYEERDRTKSVGKLTEHFKRIAFGGVD
jgi:hypothetical protein